MIGQHDDRSGLEWIFISGVFESAPQYINVIDEQGPIRSSRLCVKNQHPLGTNARHEPG
jgi:hypothetical protein